MVGSKRWLVDCVLKIGNSFCCVLCPCVMQALYEVQTSAVTLRYSTSTFRSIAATRTVQYGTSCTLCTDGLVFHTYYLYYLTVVKYASHVCYIKKGIRTVTLGQLCSTPVFEY